MVKATPAGTIKNVLTPSDDQVFDEFESSLKSVVALGLTVAVTKYEPSSACVVLNSNTKHPKLSTCRFPNVVPFITMVAMPLAG